MRDDLFGMSDVQGMVRDPDHGTSIAAAGKQVSGRKELQQKVAKAFMVYGPMTDGEIEKLPIFKDYGPSTVRKRRSELYQEGILLKTKERRNSMSVWELA